MIAALVEGNSIRATVRMTGVAKNTIVKLLVDIGKACAEYQDKTLRNLPCKRVQGDKYGPFATPGKRTYPTSKRAAPVMVMCGPLWPPCLIPSSWFHGLWQIGAPAQERIYKDWHGRLYTLYSDGYNYCSVEDAFGYEIDYASG